MLSYGQESDWSRPNTAEEAVILDEHNAFGEETRASGAYLGAEALERTETATSIRTEDGSLVVTDGPFSETREQLGGFYLLNCRDKAHAIELASRMPGVASGGTTIEVRPIREFN